MNYKEMVLSELYIYYKLSGGNSKVLNIRFDWYSIYTMIRAVDIGSDKSVVALEVDDFVIYKLRIEMVSKHPFRAASSIGVAPSEFLIFASTFWDNK